MILKYIFLLKFILLIKLINSKRCDTKLEVFSNPWCYRLLRLNESFKCVGLDCLLTSLVKLYTLSPQINNVYEFATLKPQQTIFIDSGDPWKKLAEISNLGMNFTNFTEIRVLISQFKLNESTFVDGVRIDSEHPNLMIHDDLSPKSLNKTGIF